MKPLNEMNQVIPLPDLFELFPSPHYARIVAGLDASRGLDPDTIFSFHRPISKKVALSWKLTEDGIVQSVLLPIDSPIEFVLLPYGPQTGECDQPTYRTVAQLALSFPPFARVQSCVSDVIKSGDVIKLLRLNHSNGERSVECRKITDTTLIQLPFSCVGEFVAIFDSHVTYTVADLVCGHVLAARRRRVQLVSRDELPEVPLDVSLFIESESNIAVEARPVNDPVTVIQLPCSDQTILVDPVNSEQQSLHSLVQHSQGAFPLLVRVADWKEETTILENNFVRPGVDLILHGTSRLYKVLALVSGCYYAVPMTYGGLFQRRPRMLAGGRQLQRQATDGLIVRVVYISLQEQLNLQLGDRLRVNNTATSSDSLANFINAEKLDITTSRIKVKELVKIPVTSTASFEEVLLGDDSSSLKSIGELADLIDSVGCEVRVELVRPSNDKSRSRHDLPLNTDIMLTNVFNDTSVYASVDSPDQPAFHIPLRTPIDVCFETQLDRSLSPLLDAARRDSSPPKVSTLDRCAELLSSDTVSLLRKTALISQSSRNMRMMQYVVTERRDVIKQPYGANVGANFNAQNAAAAAGVATTASSSSSPAVVFQVNTPTLTLPSTPLVTAADSNGEFRRTSKPVVTFVDDDDDDDDDEKEDKDETENAVTVSAKAGSFKLRIPDDGNLYRLSAKLFIEFLKCLNVDSQVVESCRKRRIDGKQFSRFTEQQMEMSGLMNPVLLHFRRQTRRC